MSTSLYFVFWSWKKLRRCYIVTEFIACHLSLPNLSTYNTTFCGFTLHPQNTHSCRNLTKDSIFKLTFSNLLESMSALKRWIVQSRFSALMVPPSTRLLHLNQKTEISQLTLTKSLRSKIQHLFIVVIVIPTLSTRSVKPNLPVSNSRKRDTVVYNATIFEPSVRKKLNISTFCNEDLNFAFRFKTRIERQSLAFVIVWWHLQIMEWCSLSHPCSMHTMPLSGTR